MKHKKMYSTIVVIILSLLAGFIFISQRVNKDIRGYYFNRDGSIKTSKNRVVSTQTFDCNEIKGFTFEYPVFQGREVISSKTEISGGKETCIISLRSPQDAQETIIVTRQLYSERDFEIPSAVILNPNKVPYILTKENSLHEIQNYGYVGFYGKNFKYWITLNGVSQKSGFGTEEFFNKVIETFKISDDTIENGYSRLYP